MSNQTEENTSNWSQVALSSVANVNPESLGSDTSQDFNFRYIDISSVHTGVIDWSTVTTQIFRTSPSRARRVIRPDDVLLCTVRPRLRAHTYASWKDIEGYVCSTGFAVLRSGENLSSRFLYHLVFSETIESQIRAYEVGSNYPAINESDVESLVIPFPASLEEQRAIAQILDTIDEAIATAAAHIEKLKLAKAGLLHDLITRGIDENGELRDPIRHPEQFKESELGLIPKNWDVSPLREKRRLDSDCLTHLYAASQGGN